MGCVDEDSPESCRKPALRVGRAGTGVLEGNVSPERSERRRRLNAGWERETGNGEKGTVEILCGSAPLRETFIPGIPCTIRLPAPVALWSPEDPNLYSFTARYGADEIKGYFGMRKFEKRKDAKGVWRFFLNNRPYYVMATLDQGWWPDGLLTPPSEEAMAFDIQTLKDCGFNAMRKHIKVEPLRYYALCDRLGLLVLQDMPCTSFDAQATYKAESVKGYGLFREELKGMIDLLRKVPSIVMWIPYNEGWGHGRMDVYLCRLGQGACGSNRRSDIQGNVQPDEEQVHHHMVE